MTLATGYHASDTNDALDQLGIYVDELAALDQAMTEASSSAVRADLAARRATLERTRDYWACEAQCQGASRAAVNATIRS